MKAVVIGGGIIGLCSAYYLQKAGWQVTVVDRTQLMDSCSYGNLGMIVPSHFVPLAAPGMLARGIRWMFSARSPFYIKPGLNFKLLSWGLQFIKSATYQNVERSAIPLRDMNLYSKTLYEKLSVEPGFNFDFEKKGILMYFKSDATAEEEIQVAEKARSLGLEAEVLDKGKVQMLEPGTKLDILGAVHYKCDAHLYPNDLMHQLIHHLEMGRVELKTNASVKEIIIKRRKVEKIITEKEEIHADIFIIAAGSWLSELAGQAGLNIPLMPGKGYSFTLTNPLKKLNIPAILCEARVAMTPMRGGMRIGGTMEIGPVNNRINLKRLQGIVEAVPQYFPEIKPPLPLHKDTWYGFRPCSPDGLPYIGRSAKISNLLIAGGHAMSGLSMGAATGKIMAGLAAGENPEVKIEAFNPERFHRS